MARLRGENEPMKRENVATDDLGIPNAKPTNGRKLRYKKRKYTRHQVRKYVRLTQIQKLQRDIKDIAKQVVSFQRRVGYNFNETINHLQSAYDDIQHWRDTEEVIYNETRKTTPWYSK